jgi:hypothetical protein
MTTQRQRQRLSILALPNRHGLGKGEVWEWFREQLPPTTEIELLDATTSAIPTGDRVLLMGQRTLQQFTSPDASIFTSRGALLQCYGRYATATFDLQDAFDFKNMGHDNVYEESATDNATGKDRAATSKANWPFWITQDAKKLLAVTEPPVIESPRYLIPQYLHQYTDRLLTVKDATIYLDIEVSLEAGKLDCVGVAVNDSPVTVFPIYNYKHELHYPRGEVLRFLAALSTALQRNHVVVHNAMFDLVYLLSECRLPIGRDVFDTMLCQQRLFPEVEKSLGHAISMWTWQPWHKGEGGTPMSYEQQARFWEYNAKDVWTTRMVHRAQLRYLRDNPTYQPSVDQVMASIYPYIVATCTGCRIDNKQLLTLKHKLAARLHQLTRILRILTDNPKLNPSSVDQLRKFFFDKLAYKPTGYTETGRPELGEKQLYQLALRYDNPVLQLLLVYRELDKELSMASFQGYYLPWRQQQELI